ncbi:transcriptional regulator [Marinilabiliaceae bacterium JC040]|nr:transcriptional regulator [Marinilabiliaceae bacterium JC040]
MEFNSIIKERRKILGISQQDLADYSDVSVRLIKSIETNKANPTVKTLSKICDVLGLELIMKIKEIN